MTTVWLSHLGENSISGLGQIDADGNTIRQIIESIEKAHPGFESVVLSKKSKSKFDVSTRVYYRPAIIEDANNQRVIHLPEEQTSIIESPDDPRVIAKEDNVLFSILKPDKFKEFLEMGLMDKGQIVEVPSGPSSKERITPKFFLRNEELNFKPQKMLAFCEGVSTLAQLTQNPGRSPEFKYKGANLDVLERFDRKNSRILPKRLSEAICRIWKGFTPSSHLRLFQEDAFFFILTKLDDPAAFEKGHLLISAPTGGGKTEAFVFPLVAHILFEKEKFLLHASPSEDPIESVKAIIMFPTKALANDQTKRMMELLYSINDGLSENQMVTIGIMTGDTPRTEYQLKQEPLIQLCPACAHANITFEQENGEPYFIRCQHPGCGKVHKFCRLTVQDIISRPPDILITNPDTISVSLQNPQRRKLFSSDLRAVVLDEIHLYDGIFGCNVSHMLRRLEDCAGSEILYLGLSATIENAGQLAALMFDAEPEEILYLRETKTRPYQFDDKSDRVRYHAVARPADFQSIIRSCLNTALAISHSFSDPANRKLLIFANKTDDVDRLVTYMDEAETKYFHEVVRDVLPKIERKVPLDKAEKEALSEVGGWYQYLQGQGSPFLGAVYPGWHRGALKKKQRLEAINRFMSLKPIETGGYVEYPIDIMIATRTLELGIDIGTVSTVINCSAPLSTNEYYQRVGRGGRRGNSLALTILNDAGAIDAYFYAKFDELIDSPEYESIPIIITNKMIARQHVFGRILDLLAEDLKSQSGAFDVKVKHLRNLRLEDEKTGTEIGLEQAPESFGVALFARIFKGGEGTKVDKYLKWLMRESAILRVAPTEITEDLMKNWLVDKCRNLALHGDPSKPDLYWDSDKSLSSYFDAVDRDLLTPLRGDGETVSIFAKGTGEDKFVEEVSRIRAVRSFPPNAYARQGLNSFQILNPVLKADDETERQLVDLFWDYEKLLAYFGDRLGQGFPRNQRELRYFSGQVVVPEELQVTYAPYRFYCDNLNCLRNYTSDEVDRNLICRCGRPLKQLTQFIMCPQCGDLMEPPVPRVCINPSCIQRRLDSDREFLRKLRSGGTYVQASTPLFRFRSLSKQQWRCVDCGVVFNFYNYHLGMWKDPRLRQVKDLVVSGQALNNMNLDNALGIALKFLYFPEHFKRGDEYIRMGYRPAMFKHWSRYGGCDRASSGMRVVNVPRVTTFQHRYLRKIRELDEPLTVAVGKLEVFELQVVDIAEEYSRAYEKGSSPRRRELVYKVERIPDNKYLANLFETHAFSLNAGEQVKKFLESPSLPESCKERCTADCPHLANLDQTVREIYLPKQEVNPWELRDNRPMRSDPRSAWCPEAGKTECSPTCENCSYHLTNLGTLRTSFLKYIVIHTLKHSLVWALPKYVGINLMGLNGQIYPNQNNIREDPLKGEILVMDSAENGSGAMLLVNRNWDRIWNFSSTVLRLTYEGRGNLNLPYSCFRFNNDLCPYLALQFSEFVGGQ
jgi:superfamily II DNA/RNA helicase